MDIEISTKKTVKKCDFCDNNVFISTCHICKKDYCSNHKGGSFESKYMYKYNHDYEDGESLNAIYLHTCQECAEPLEKIINVEKCVENLIEDKLKKLYDDFDVDVIKVHKFNMNREYYFR